MKDGVVLMYVKDNTIYPVGMTQEQLDMLQLMVKGIFGEQPLKVIDKPQGEAVNLME